MGIRYISRIGGQISGSFANPQPGFAEEAMDDGAAEYLAWVASLVPQAAISLAVLQARIEAESAWDTYVNYMFATAARRNAFLKAWVVGRPIKTNNSPFITSLLGCGLTQAQVDRILAPNGG